MLHSVYIFMQCGTLRKKSDMWFTGGRISRFERKNLKF
jgi:hypothetical protein